MTAQVAQASTERAAVPVDASSAIDPPVAGLSALFAERVRRTPSALAFVDQAGREAWCGRPRIAWSWGAAEPIVERLARFFSGLGLPPGAPVAVCLAGGSETPITLLALERAGLTPCLLPLAWPRDELARAVEEVGAVAIVTQATVGALKPAETFRDIAMAFFGLRFVTAFGPQVPDGVVDLDRVIVDSRPLVAGRSGDFASPDETSAPVDEPGIVTVARHGSAIEAVWRPASSWLEAAADVLAQTRIAPGERLVSLIAPDDLMGLSTGFVAALLAGVPLESHGLFDGPALAAALADGTPTRLVAPGWMEPALAAADLPGSVTGLVFVHAAPTRFRARAGFDRPVVDVLALEPWALVARARGRGGRIAMRLDDMAGARGPRVRRDETGAIVVAGPGTQARPWSRGALGAASDRERTTPWRAEVFAGILIGVT